MSIWEEAQDAVADSMMNSDGRASAYYLEHHFMKAGLGIYRMPDAPYNAAELRKLLDAADGALDKETYEQIVRNDDLPDDAEVWITAGTRRKLNALIAEVDRLLKSSSPTSQE